MDICEACEREDEFFQSFRCGNEFIDVCIHCYSCICTWIIDVMGFDWYTSMGYNVKTRSELDDIYKMSKRYDFLISIFSEDW